MEQISCLIKNAYTITMDSERRVLTNACIAVSNDRILAVGGAELSDKYSADRVLDASGRILFPGFIDTHMHMFQTMFKGLGRDKKLFDWLDASVRPCLHRLDGDVCYQAALIGCIESIHSGASTILDFMYAHAVPGTDDYVLKAMDTIGIRGILGRAHADTSTFPPKFHVTYNESEDQYFRDAIRLHNITKGHSRLDACLAPGIIFDLSEDGFIETRKIADETGMIITTHLLETKDDDEYCLSKNKRRCTDYLDKLGVLGPDFLAVHCVVATDEDISYFKKHDVKISYNPISNMILASGAAPIKKLQEAGLTIGLACDGAASNDTQDMIEVLKAATLLQKVSTQDASSVPASDVLEMATINGARCVGKEKEIGSIEAGKKADIVFYDPYCARSAPVYDPVSSLIYASGHENIEAMMIDGKMVMENRVITTIDEEKAIYDVQQTAVRLGKELDLGNSQWGRRMPRYEG